MSKPPPVAARGLAEIPWVLMQQYWKNGVSPQDAVGAVCIRRAISLGVSLRALTIAGVVVLSLPPAGKRAGCKELERVNGAAECQSEFLSRRKGRRIWNIAGVEVRNDAENTLMFLLPQLLFRRIALRLRDRRIRRLLVFSG